MNLLSLKTVVWDDLAGSFRSPTRTEFIWPKGVIASDCHKCNDEYDPNCHCGIYSSPNPTTLKEYATYTSSVFVLLNLYGWVDIWTAPRDIPHAYVLRSWGAQIIGIVGDNANGKVMSLSATRQLTAINGATYYGVEIYPWQIAEAMISVTWKRHTNVVKDPYIKKEWN